MKKLIRYDIGDYTFNPANKTIKFWEVNLNKEQFLTITNTTDNTLIYVFADPTLNGTFDGQILTLNYDTSLMSDNDALQIYVDVPDVQQSQKLLSQLNIGDVVLLQDETTGELYTQDRNLANILGGTPVGEGGYLRVKNKFDDKIVSGRLGVLGEALGIDCRGYSTVGVELSGTWAGTITFEGRTDTGNWVVINGLATNGTTLVTTSTTNGVYRFSTAGIIYFQIRFSAFTSGTLLATLESSAEIGMVGLSNPVSGSQTQPLSQKSSTFELNTYDTNLVSILGTAVLYRLGNLASIDPVVAPTVNITQPTTYADNRYAKYPQILPRLRVEIGGDQKLPLAQEINTNRLLISQPEIYAMLEAILLQLKILNQMYVNVNENTPPPGWEEIR